MDVNKVYPLLMIEEKTRNHPSLKDLHNAAMDELMQLNAEEAGPTPVRLDWPAPNQPKGRPLPQDGPLPGGPFQGNLAGNKEPEHAS